MGSVLSVKDLSLKVDNKKLFSNVTFEISNGDVLLLSGANGIGKSSLLKSLLRLDMRSKTLTGEIVYNENENVLSLGRDELQQYRAKVAYIQQSDEYKAMGNIRVRDIISESNIASSGHSLSNSQVNELIDQWIPRRNDNTRVFDANSKPNSFSGGEARLLSVLSVIVTRSSAKLMIIDEPLNNLDFNNAKNISNMINKVRRDNPQMGIIMVSHCRIFPFVSRELVLSADGVSDVQSPYSCHSCIGIPDCNGFYS